jgi:excisionase family DNA binding protein
MSESGEPTPIYIGLSEAARLAQMSEGHLRRLADKGELPCIRSPGGQRRFDREDVLALIGRAS